MLSNKTTIIKKQARFTEGDLIIERSNFNSFCLANSYIRNIMLEMNRLNVNILSVCKIRWPNNGDFVCDKHQIMYADREKKAWKADEILVMMKWKQK